MNIKTNLKNIYSNKLWSDQVGHQNYHHGLNRSAAKYHAASCSFLPAVGWGRKLKRKAQEFISLSGQHKEMKCPWLFVALLYKTKTLMCYQRYSHPKSKTQLYTSNLKEN